ncbi:MAG TPA: cupin domain-containing protein [Solirubrobacterales bacterium]|nr:cupin domain-containing protein [Solirubrobacterales bacterium]
MSTVAAAPTVTVGELGAPRVIRFEDLAPAWGLAYRSQEAGFFRWLATYVGGPPGFLEQHPETGIVGDHSVLGVMGLPAGQRQYGLHRHPTTEIYLILRGRVESIEGEGKRQFLGPLDCLFIPRTAPHCVRTVGEEDVLLLYVHDEHEKLGEAKYVDDDDPSLLQPEPHPSVIRWEELEPWWGAPEATVAGHMRWSVNWVGRGPAGPLNPNPGEAEDSGVGLGMTVIAAASVGPEEVWDSNRYLFVHQGKVRVEGHPDLPLLGPLDLLVVPRGCPHALRAVGVEPAHVIWFHEDLPGSA